MNGRATQEIMIAYYRNYVFLAIMMVGKMFCATSFTVIYFYTMDIFPTEFRYVVLHSGNVQTIPNMNRLVLVLSHQRRIKFRETDYLLTEKRRVFKTRLLRFLYSA